MVVKVRVSKISKIISYLFLFTLFINTFVSAVLYKLDSTHIPLAILIDRSENPEDKFLEATSLTCRDLIRSKSCAILMSQSLLYNFLYRKKNWDDTNHNENKELKDISFTSKEWAIYHPEKTQFYLLLPAHLTGLLRFFKENLKKKKVETKGKDYFDLIDVIDPKKIQIPSIQANDLEKFLKITPKFLYGKEALGQSENEADSVIWDVYMLGHGCKDVSICGLSLKVMQDFLMFFNNKVNTGIFIVSSCYVGGTNLDVFKFKKSMKFFPSLDYLVVALGTRDVSTHYIRPDYSQIFSLVAHLGKNEEATLQKLLLLLNLGKDREMIPQIILPGGIEIQTLYPGKEVVVIGTVKAKIMEREKKTLKLFNLEKNFLPSTFLIYPVFINFSMQLKPGLKSLNLRETLSSMPTLYELVAKDAFKVLMKKQLSTSTTSVFYGIQNLLNKMLPPENEKWFYPVSCAFISMIPGDATHFLKKIVVEGWGLPHTWLDGVMHFIRNAFFNISGRKSKKCFLIEKLIGRNDLIFLLEGCRIVGGKTIKSELERIGEIKRNEDILVLRNVIITTEGTSVYDEVLKKRVDKIILSLSFALSDSAWQLDFNENIFNNEKDIFWNFKEIDFESYNKKFSEQKKMLNFLYKHNVNTANLDYYLDGVKLYLCINTLEKLIIDIFVTKADSDVVEFKLSAKKLPFLDEYIKYRASLKSNEAFQNELSIGIMKCPVKPENYNNYKLHYEIKTKKLNEVVSVVNIVEKRDVVKSTYLLCWDNLLYFLTKKTVDSHLFHAKNIFCIDELDARQNLLLLLQAHRVLDEVSQPSELEKILLEKRNIILQNIIIKINKNVVWDVNDKWFDCVFDFQISFIVGDTAWETVFSSRRYQSKDSGFYKIDKTKHESSFKDLTDRKVR